MKTIIFLITLPLAVAGLLWMALFDKDPYSEEYS
jgi:hypothetical protein